MCHDVLYMQATQSIKKQRLSAAGKAIADVEHHDVHHTRKDAVKVNSTACGSCYGAETAALTCCNTCEDVSVFGGGDVGVVGVQQSASACAGRLGVACQHSTCMT